MRNIRPIYLTISILGLILILVGLTLQPVVASTLSGFTATPTSTNTPLPTATFTPVPPTVNTPTPNAPQPTQPPPPPPPPDPPPLLPETGADNAPDVNMGDIDLVILGSLLLTTGLVLRARYVRRYQI